MYARTNGTEMNENGLTWARWCLAAGMHPWGPTRDLPRDVWERAHTDWQDGCDPSDWRVFVERHCRATYTAERGRCQGDA